GMYWAVAALQTLISAVLVIAAVLVLAHLARPGKSDHRVRAASRMRRADDAGLPVAGPARREGTFRLFLFASWTITLATLAWIAVSLDEVSDVRRQVAEAFASVAFER